MGENEIGKIKFCIFSLALIYFLENYFLAQSTVEKKLYSQITWFAPFLRPLKGMYLV